MTGGTPGGRDGELVTREGTRRCFVAVPLGAEAVERLLAVQRALAARLPEGGLRWTRREQLHLTLRFLGGLPPPDVARARDGLERACRGRAPFELETAAPGLFPGPRRPSVAWLGVGGDVAALRALRDDVLRELAGLGRPPEARPFRAHLTLARVKDARAGAALARALAALPEPEPARWRVARVELVASELRPTGAVYTPLAEARLEP